jgi:hypothetical protein
MEMPHALDDPAIAVDQRLVQGVVLFFRCDLPARLPEQLVDLRERKVVGGREAAGKCRLAAACIADYGDTLPD